MHCMAMQARLPANTTREGVSFRARAPAMTGPCLELAWRHLERVPQRPCICQRNLNLMLGVFSEATRLVFVSICSSLVLGEAGMIGSWSLGTRTRRNLAVVVPVAVAWGTSS